MGAGPAAKRLRPACGLARGSRAASLSLASAALPERGDEGRALHKSREIRDPVLADSAGLRCLMSKPHVLL